jgi:uncharacterized protein (TIGR03066 family)
MYLASRRNVDIRPPIRSNACRTNIPNPFKEIRMNAVRMAVVGCAVLGLAASLSRAEDKKDSNKEKIVGTWLLVKSETETPPEATMEFTKDGKMKVSFKIGEKTVSVDGTYEIDGDKINVAMKVGDKEKKDTGTIKTLTDKTLVIVDTKGKADEYKRK